MKPTPPPRNARAAAPRHIATAGFAAALLLLAGAGCGDGGADAPAAREDAGGTDRGAATSTADDAADSGSFDVTVTRDGETVATFDQETGRVRDVAMLLGGVQVEGPGGITVRISCGGDGDPADAVTACDTLTRNNTWVMARLPIEGETRGVKCTLDDDDGPGQWRAEDVGGERMSGSFDVTLPRCMLSEAGSPEVDLSLTARGSFERIPIGEGIPGT